jgi:hypothetical protein
MKGVGGGKRTEFLGYCEDLRQLDAPDANGWRLRYGQHIKHHFDRTDIADIFRPMERSRYITDSEWARWMAAEGAAAELSSVVQEILRGL